MKKIYILLVNYCALIATPQSLGVPEIYQPETTAPTKSPRVKDWTFLTYMAADNDLAPFSRRNLSQQAAVGSTNNINVLVHLDTRIPGNKKITKRYCVDKGQLTIKNSKTTQWMDSGDPQTLIDACEWAIKNYPARHYALILWNHGTGVIDIVRPRTINPSELFSFDQATNMIKLDRSIPFLEFVSLSDAHEMRGVCFDDTTGNYLTNQGLEYALNHVCTNFLHGNRFSIIGFDACLMSMLEVANYIKGFTEYMVGSQEVELGTGWRYDLVLAPFAQQTLTPTQFAKHIVDAYEATYSRITHDYTQSALLMKHVQDLEDALSKVAELLLLALKHQKNNSVKDIIRTSRHKLLCTHFDEPSYIDLHHFLRNLQSNLNRMKLTQDHQHIAQDLHHAISRAGKLIGDVVCHNVAGRNLSQAMGISICFPERRLHSSYHRTNFAKTNAWFSFVEKYLNS